MLHAVQHLHRKMLMQGNRILSDQLSSNCEAALSAFSTPLPPKHAQCQRSRMRSRSSLPRLQLMHAKSASRTATPAKSSPTWRRSSASLIILETCGGWGSTVPWSASRLTTASVQVWTPARCRSSSQTSMFLVGIQMRSGLCLWQLSMMTVKKSIDTTWRKYPSQATSWRLCIQAPWSTWRTGAIMPTRRFACGISTCLIRMSRFAQMAASTRRSWRARTTSTTVPYSLDTKDALSTESSLTSSFGNRYVSFDAHL